jgi:photosystem II stability/assembly factor-like uncharacterized protein
MYVYTAAPKNLYKSTDGGDNFTLIAAFPYSNIGRFDSDPVDASIIYASGNNYLYVSTDSGATWGSKVGPKVSGVDLQVSYLCIDVADRNTLYIACRNYTTGYGCYKATTGPAVVSGDWVANGLASLDTCQLIQDPSDPLKLYMLVDDGDGKFWYTEDGGANWYMSTPTANATVNYIENAIAVLGLTQIPPQTKRPVYLAAYNASETGRVMLVTTDNGGTFPKVWQDTSVTMSGPNSWFMVDPTNDDIIYRLMEGNAAKASSDRGDTWQTWFNLRSTFLEAHLSRLTESALVVAGSQSYLYRTQDRFASPPSWVSVGPAGVSLLSFALDANNPYIGYALGTDGKVYKTTNVEASPITWDAGTAAGLSTSAQWIYAADGQLWVVGTRYSSTVLRKSTDEGATWASPTDPSGSITSLIRGCLFADPGNPLRLWVCASNGRYGIWLTEDGGTTWAAVYGDNATDGYQCYSLSWVPDLPQAFLAGHKGGVLISKDNGLSFGPISADVGSSSRKFLSIAAGWPPPPAYTITADTTLAANDDGSWAFPVPILMSGTSLTLTLPVITAAVYAAHALNPISVTNLDASALTVQGQSSQKIDGASTVTQTQDVTALYYPALVAGGAYAWHKG